MKNQLLALILMAVTTNAEAEWTLFDSKEGVKNYYIDLNTIRKEGNAAKVWTMISYEAVESTSEGKLYTSAKDLWIFDCKRDTGYIASINYYDGSMGKGDFVDSVNINEKKSGDPIVPGTTLEWIFKKACNKK